MMAYFGQSLLLFLVCWALGIGLTMIFVDLVMSRFDDLSLTFTKMTVIGAIVMLIAPIFFRFAAILPSAALGERLTWGAAWRATKGSTGALMLVSLVLWVGLIWVSEHATNLISGNLFLLTLWVIPFRWVFLMINVSILTTLYGHYVEKRAWV